MTEGATPAPARGLTMSCPPPAGLTSAGNGQNTRERAVRGGAVHLPLAPVRPHLDGQRLQCEPLVRELEAVQPRRHAARIEAQRLQPRRLSVARGKLCVQPRDARGQLVPRRLESRALGPYQRLAECVVV